MSNFLSSKSLMRVWYSWITFLIAAIDSFTCFLLVLTKHKLITLMTVCHVFSRVEDGSCNFVMRISRTLVELSEKDVEI